MSQGSASGESIQVPRTTKGDIVQLAVYWNDAWTQLEDAWRRGNVIGHIDDPRGLTDERTCWQTVATEVETTAKAGNTSDVYPKNDEFFHGLGGPLLLGASGIVALWLLLRDRDPVEGA